MSNILLVSDDLRRAGAEKVVVTLAAAFRQLGHAVTIVLLQNEIEYEVPPGVGVEVYGGGVGTEQSAIKRVICGLLCPVSWWLLKGVRTARDFEGYLAELENRKGKFDRIYLHAAGAYGPLWRFNRDNLEICVHNNKSGQFLSGSRLVSRPLCARLVARLYRGKSIIAVSQGIRSDLIENFRINAEQVRVIPNPLDFDAIREWARQEVPELPGRYVVNVARMSPQKRQDLLIKAFALLRTDHKLVLVGREDAVFKRQLEELAHALGVADRVVFLGLRSNPYPIIKNADLLVSSSSYEGFGLVLVEAMALGVPVVSTDCPSGPGEILADYRRQLVPVGDAAALAARIEETLANPYSIDEAKLAARYGMLSVAANYLDTPTWGRHAAAGHRDTGRGLLVDG